MTFSSPNPLFRHVMTQFSFPCARFSKMEQAIISSLLRFSFPLAVLFFSFCPMFAFVSAPSFQSMETLISDYRSTTWGRLLRHPVFLLEHRSIALHMQIFRGIPLSL